MTPDAAARDSCPAPCPTRSAWGFAPTSPRSSSATAPSRSIRSATPTPCASWRAADRVGVRAHQPEGRRAGIFTQALLDVLAAIGDTPIGWAAIGDALRARVMRQFVLQRPDIEGPAERQMFSLAIDARAPPSRSARRRAVRIQTGWITALRPATSTP